MVSCIDAKLQQKVAEYLLSAAFSLWSFLCCDSHYLYALASCNPTAIPRQPHGRCFHVHKPQDFVEQIMPKYFRQSKLTSFQRQLNLYGFSRITAGDDRGGYYHELFLRNKVFLCQNMVRRCDCASLLPWLPQSTCTHFLHLFANNITKRRIVSVSKELGSKARQVQPLNLISIQCPLCHRQIQAIRNIIVWKKSFRWKRKRVAQRMVRRARARAQGVGRVLPPLTRVKLLWRFTACLLPWCHQTLQRNCPWNFKATPIAGVTITNVSVKMKPMMIFLIHLSWFHPNQEIMSRLKVNTSTTWILLCLLSKLNHSLSNPDHQVQLYLFRWNRRCTTQSLLLRRHHLPWVSFSDKKDLLGISTLLRYSKRRMQK